MARKTLEDALGVAGSETIIGTGVTVRGNLHSESDITIDGQLNGDIKTTGDVTIGMNGRVTANIQGANVSVAGNLTGNIKASGEVSIRETGHVEGDITAMGLAISSGAVFIGRSIMEAPPTLAEPAPDPKLPEPTNPVDRD